MWEKKPDGCMFLSSFCRSYKRKMLKWTLVKNDDGAQDWPPKRAICTHWLFPIRVLWPAFIRWKQDIVSTGRAPYLEEDSWGLTDKSWFFRTSLLPLPKPFGLVSFSKIIISLSKKNNSYLLWSLLWVSYFSGLPYIQIKCFLQFISLTPI